MSRIVELQQEGCTVATTTAVVATWTLRTKTAGYEDAPAEPQVMTLYAKGDSSTSYTDALADLTVQVLPGSNTNIGYVTILSGTAFEGTAAPMRFGNTNVSHFDTLATNGTAFAAFDTYNAAAVRIIADGAGTTGAQFSLYATVNVAE